ncbi:MAG: hypothetical protein M1542_08360 [Thermotogae bacterium]|jgi:hypothetical protein|nr:hypothetical protein [Thermotogota bacterium]MCL5033240.1 hypothetical protein [Thermotogota bacterium]
MPMLVNYYTKGLAQMDLEAVLGGKLTRGIEDILFARYDIKVYYERRMMYLKNTFKL